MFRSELKKLLDELLLRSSFYATLTFQKQDTLDKIVALNEKQTKLYEQAEANFKEELKKLQIKFTSMFENSDWSRKYQIKTLNWELDFYKNREKRRSENRREKRLRKKQRQAAAKGRMDIDANEVDEE